MSGTGSEKGQLIRSLPDAVALAGATAELFALQASLAVGIRGRFAVALAGGETPRHAYELLARPPFLNSVPWRETHVFFGDERCVPPDDPRSNQLMARESFLDRVPIPKGQVHPMACDGDPDEAAMRYETMLRGFFGTGLPRFDLVLLGMGPDGHTASLFPGSPALNETARWAVGVCPPTQELCRVTLTVPVINGAAVVAFSVSGEDKASVLRDVLEGPSDPCRLPSQLIQPENGRLLWLLDEAAASRLSPSAG